jgi:cysteinyl-tRNA synthetase
MSIKIFNTLTRKKETFRPIKKGRVGIYVCGPTVYDEPHIGHLRSAYVFEVIRRYFAYSGYKVKFVKNITDVDDKIIEKAREEWRAAVTSHQSPVMDLKEKVKEVAERCIGKYRRAMEDFGIIPPDIEPRATEHIPEMLKLVEGLIKKDFAYQKGGDVYFSVRKFSRYGRLSHQSIDELKSGVRVEPAEGKFDPLDFALWKGAKEDEPSWKTSWGQGRPGWHIECSAMSTKYLGRNFDIHGGGKDLIFPHHENEIAQSESFTGKPFANYWIHNGLLTINGQKMSKSLGNFICVDELLGKLHPEVLKLFFLSAHYSHPIDFTFEKMEEAKRARERFYILFEKINGGAPGTRHQAPGKRKILISSVKKFRQEFFEAMDDDFNTPKALAVLFDLVNFAHKNFANKGMVTEAKFLLLELGKIFGLFENLSKGIREIRGGRDLDIGAISKLIEKRNEFRKAKNFARADRIRQELEKEGIIIEDGPDKTTWRLKM